MSKAGDMFVNPVTGERVVVRVRTEEAGGELLIGDLYLRPGGAVMGEPIHPAIEERFTVLGGQVGFRLAGRATTAEPGVELSVPPGFLTTGGTQARRKRSSVSRFGRAPGSRRCFATRTGSPRTGR
jgi:hypothetical protein